MSDPVLDHVTVVLCSPTEPRNVGAACRALKAMGLRSLRLVTPAHGKGGVARSIAHGAEDVLDDALVAESLDEAIADCHVVCGTTARRRQLRKDALVAPERLADLVVAHAASGRVAILFGTERTGLTNEEVDVCRYVSMVPTDEGQPSLNLAQAVTLYTWEVRQAWLRAAGRPQWVGAGSRTGAPPRPPEMMVRHPHRATRLPTQRELATMYAHLGAAMVVLGYSDFERRKFLTYLRQLHQRAGMVDWELQIYHILAARILELGGAPKFQGVVPDDDGPAQPDG